MHIRGCDGIRDSEAVRKNCHARALSIESKHLKTGKRYPVKKLDACYRGSRLEP